MREIVFSIGLTVLTGTLIFIYFRNKIINIDKKVNVVFETIQDHNMKLQQQAQMEMQRFAAYQESRMTEKEAREVEHVEQNNGEQNALNLESDTNLIDVSEDDSDDFSSDSEDDDNVDDNVEDDVDNSDKVTEVDEISDKLEISEGLNGLEGLEVLDGEINLEKQIVQTDVDYSKLTKAQLIICCEDVGISFKKSSNKSLLIELLENNKQKMVTLEQ
jgi:hypothetical protein